MTDTAVAGRLLDEYRERHVTPSVPFSTHWDIVPDHGFTRFWTVQPPEIDCWSQ